MRRQASFRHRRLVQGDRVRRVRVASGTIVHLVDETPITAERLTLVSKVGWRYLDEPAFVRPGERYWLEDSVVVIERLSGVVERRSTNHGDPETAPRLM